MPPTHQQPPTHPTSTHLDQLHVQLHIAHVDAVLVPRVSLNMAEHLCRGAGDHADGIRRYAAEGVGLAGACLPVGHQRAVVPAAAGVQGCREGRKGVKQEGLTPGCCRRFDCRMGTHQAALPTSPPPLPLPASPSQLAHPQQDPVAAPTPAAAYPLSTSSTTGLTAAWYTSDWLASGPSTRSNSNSLEGMLACLWRSSWAMRVGGWAGWGGRAGGRGWEETAATGMHGLTRHPSTASTAAAAAQPARVQPEQAGGLAFGLYVLPPPIAHSL
jgi:hypothetical protein